MPKAQVVQYSTPEGARYQLVWDHTIVKDGFMWVTAAQIFALELGIPLKPW
jgi:hypothetical protein